VAVVIRDADRFSVTLRDDARPCVVTLDARPDPVACEGFTPAERLPAETSELRTLAVGALRIEGAAATISSTLEKTATDEGATTQASLEAFAGGLASGYAKQVPGASARKPQVKLLNVNGLSVGQVRCDLDGVPPKQRVIEHLVSYVVQSADGIYTFSMTTDAANAAATDAFAAEVISTVTIAHPARTRDSAAYRMGLAVGGLVGTLLLLGAAALVTWLILRRSKSASP
jgi:hypothetical protein